MTKIIGIYIITNVLENKHYIGQSVHCLERFSKHKSLLRKNIHSNPHLQNSWNKHGEKAFTFEVLEEYENEFLFSFENFWCNMLNVHNRLHGYNSDSINPTGSLNHHHSKETIEKIRKANTGKKHSKETKEKLKIINTGKKYSEKLKELLRNNKKNQAIDVYDNNGNFISSYKSIRDCERNLKIDSSCIRNCISGKYNLTKNKIIKFHGEILTKDEVLNRNKNSFSTKKIKVLGYYLDGSLIGRYDSCYQAGLINNLDSYKISLCVRKIQKRVKNTVWYLDT